MPANVTPIPHADDFDFTPDPAAATVGDGGTKSVDPQIVSDGDMRTMRRQAPWRSHAAIVAGGLGAALLGGAVGYWLGGRRVARTPARVRHAASSAESLIGLAPVALHLMGNPLVRSLAFRLLMRKLTSLRAA